MEKACLAPECEQMVVKRKTESKARFEKRKFCSTTCSYKYLKENQMGWWKKK